MRFIPKRANQLSFSVMIPSSTSRHLEQTGQGFVGLLRTHAVNDQSGNAIIP
jgi:hypothetical protein